MIVVCIVVQFGNCRPCRSSSLSSLSFSATTVRVCPVTFSIDVWIEESSYNKKQCQTIVVMRAANIYKLNYSALIGSYLNCLMWQ
jgi:hypothetical protein